MRKKANERKDKLGKNTIFRFLISITVSRRLLSINPRSKNNEDSGVSNTDNLTNPTPPTLPPTITIQPIYSALTPMPTHPSLLRHTKKNPPYNKTKPICETPIFPSIHSPLAYSPTTPVQTILPMKHTKPVTLSTTATRMMLRMIRPNAMKAERQKFLPYDAHCE